MYCRSAHTTISTWAVIALIFASNVCAIPGGLGEERPADDEVQRIVEQVKDDIQAHYPEKFDSIEPLKYKIQVVSGKNYFIKALIREVDGDKNYAHLRIYKSFRGPVDFASIKPNVSRDLPLEYFQ